jgi:hypothetical protein
MSHFTRTSTFFIKKFGLQSARPPVGRGWPDCHILSLLRQRKNAKKGDRASPPFGYPMLQDKKWESVETRLRLKQQRFLYPFSASHHWRLRSGNIAGSTAMRKRISQLCCLSDSQTQMQQRIPCIARKLWCT